MRPLAPRCILFLLTCSLAVLHGLSLSPENCIRPTLGAELTFRAPGACLHCNQAYSVAAGDFNKDGKADLAVTDSSSSTVSIFIGDGNAGLNLGMSYSTGSSPHRVAVGDFNNDHQADLAVTLLYSNEVLIMLGKGNATFQPGGRFAAGRYPSGVAVGDLNGDG